MICHNCKTELVLFDGFSSLQQVTSDCRPWAKGGKLAVCHSCGMVQKPVTDTWLREADEIYSRYDIYSQSAGVEQSTFDMLDGASTSRSEKIVQWLSTTQLIPKTGKLLDIGCGNGAFLKAFGKYFPEWEMVGLELDSRNKEVIESISGVKRLHIGPVSSLEDQFDLIVLIHALEHIPEPSAYLRSLSKYLSPGGLLFIEVPNLETSPFDVLIADHSTHFMSSILQRVVENAGYNTLSLKGDFVPKELSLLATNIEMAALPGAVSKENNESAVKGEDIARTHIQWLQGLLEQGRRLEGTIGIFGTSIAATWLTESLKGKVGFFVDEDENRIGRTHMGLPIYAPYAIPEGSQVLVPLRTDIAESVKKRLEDVSGAFAIPSL